jgi:HSP20 family protein
MTELNRRDPFQEMTTLRDAMNQLLAESFVRSRGWAGSSQIPLDLYETENEYVAKLEVPGLKPDNFEITMQQNVLLIKGHTQAEQQEGVRYHVQEQRFGDFNRTIQFPTPVDAEKIQASLADGILTIHVPKAEAAKPKRITIKAN